MGRKKTYDRDTLIARAMELFRDHGYAGTSTQMLVDHLGVNRYSIYAEFGDKQGLFDAALARYGDDVVGRRFGPLEDPEAGLHEIRSLLAFYAGQGAGPAAGRGRLLCNTAVELGPHDPSGAAFVERYFARLSGAFRTALGNARRRGELDEPVDIAEQAAFLTSAVLGLFVMLRATAPATMVEQATRAAIAHLDGLRASASAPTPGPASDRA